MFLTYMLPGINFCARNFHVPVFLALLCWQGIFLRTCDYLSHIHVRIPTAISKIYTVLCCRLSCVRQWPHDRMVAALKGPLLCYLVPTGPRALPTYLAHLAKYPPCVNKVQWYPLYVGPTEPFSGVA